MDLPSKDYLHECLIYYPHTGLLVWRTRPVEHFANVRAWKSWNTKYANNQAFRSIDKDGYYYGCINGKNQKAHRIIFKMLHGWEPTQIDHDDRNKQNNKELNLKAATAEVNSRNQGISKANTSGAVGVYFRYGKWNARLAQKHLGAFNTFEEAVEARKKAQVTAGYHINHGVA